MLPVVSRIAARYAGIPIGMLPVPAVPPSPGAAVQPSIAARTIGGASHHREPRNLENRDENRSKPERPATDSCMDFSGYAAAGGLWGALKMTINDRKDAKTSNKRRENRGVARRSHSIRFADSEWNLIERAAARQGVPAGEFARSGALAAAEERIAELPPAALSPGHLALIESTWRMAYVLATLNS